jgi:hypothetical protein
MVCLFLCWIYYVVVVVVDGNSNSFPTTFGFDAEVFGAIFSRFFSVYHHITTSRCAHTFRTTKTKTKAAATHRDQK